MRARKAILLHVLKATGHRVFRGARTVSRKPACPNAILALDALSWKDITWTCAVWCWTKLAQLSPLQGVDDNQLRKGVVYLGPIGPDGPNRLQGYLTHTAPIRRNEKLLMHAARIAGCKQGLRQHFQEIENQLAASLRFVGHHAMAWGTSPQSYQPLKP